MFVLPGALALHFNAIAFQSKPDGSNTHFCTLLDEIGHLLLIKALDETKSNEEEREIVLAVFTGAPPNEYADHFCTPGSLQNEVIVSALAPKHVVYHAKRERNQREEIAINNSPGTLALCASRVNIALQDGLRQLRIDKEFSCVQARVEMLEVWTMCAT